MNVSNQLPCHEAAKLASVDYELNSHRCGGENENLALLPRWIPDHERSQCRQCSLPFTTLERKHHCRSCGDIYCNNCTQYRMILTPEIHLQRNPQRVCYNCSIQLQKKQHAFIETYANSTRVNTIQSEKQFNLPYSKTLGSEIRKACNTILELLEEEQVWNQQRQQPQSHERSNPLSDIKFSLSQLDNAKGIVFLTIMKGGFIFAPRVGTGLVMSKLLDGRWSAPSAIATIGISWGALIGLDITDYMIVLHDLEAVRAFTGDGQVILDTIRCLTTPHITFSPLRQVSLGGEIKVSVGGLGRTGAGELLIGDHGLATALSYCHSKGLFAGVSLEGSMIISRPEVNLNFYGQPVTPYQLLSGEISPPEAASCLYQALNTAMDTSDRFRGISRQERQHQEMLKLLDPQNSMKFLSSKEFRNGEEDDSTRGIGDQYY